MVCYIKGKKWTGKKCRDLNLKERVERLERKPFVMPRMGKPGPGGNI